MTYRSCRQLRITGQERVTLSRDFVRRYKKGESIRELAHSSGRSYGFVHRILAEAGTEFRARGGHQPRRA
jgi:predicted transcriptional regulator